MRLFKKHIKRFKYGTIPPFGFQTAIFSQENPKIRQKVIFAVIDEEFVFGEKLRKGEKPRKKGDILFINLDENDEPTPTRYNMNAMSPEKFRNSFERIIKTADDIEQIW